MVRLAALEQVVSPGFTVKRQINLCFPEEATAF